jgi:hypothetical protein
MTNSIEKEILKDVLNNPGDTFYENVLSDFLDEQGVEHDFRKPLHKERIEELKSYQEKCLDVWAKHWISVGLCTKQTDENKVERYFFDFYKELGLEKPKNIIWINNPVEMYNQAWNQARNQLRNQARNQLRNQVWNQVFNQVWDHVLNHVLNQVWDHVLNYVWDQVWDRVWSQVNNQISNQIGNQVLNQIWHQIWNQIFYGQQDAHWLAYYAYIMQVLRVEAPKQFALLMLLAQEVNWWFLAEQTVFVTRKPKECVFEDGKLIKLVFQDDYTIT